MVPMWDTRVARAYRGDEVSDAETSSPRSRTANVRPPTGSAAGILRRGLERFARLVLFDLRRVKPVPASV